MIRHKANQACLLLNPTKGLNGINIGPLISFIGLEALSKKMQMNYEVIRIKGSMTSMRQNQSKI
jgi:hypothetical protein